MSLNEAFRRARIAANLDQSQLARRSKVPQGTISRVENGGDPRLSTARKIARALNGSIEDVFFGAESVTVAPPPRTQRKKPPKKGAKPSARPGTTKAHTKLDPAMPPPADAA